MQLINRRLEYRSLMINSRVATASAFLTKYVHILAQTLPSFTELDTNADGYLIGEELTEISEFIIATTDADGDGLIDIEEYSTINVNASDGFSD